MGTSDSKISLVNTLNAGNLVGGDCSGEGIVSEGHNLDSDGSCNLGEATDLPEVESGLEPLQGNGGSTLSHAPGPGSPAIDAGGGEACPINDQRGVSRPQGTECDIGAVEFAR